MVARAFLAGPPLLKAATGEIATEEELGGAEMHTAISGLGEYMAEDDADAVRLAREVLQRLQWSRRLAPAARASTGPAPRLDPQHLLGIMSADGRKPADMREVIGRIVDASDFLEFKALYGPATITGHAAIQGHPVGIICNNGPLDPDGANKATHFIQACCQSGTPLVYLQNTTGYMVRAPMAGRIVAVQVAVGQTVARGTPLVVLEAMKMEHPSVAPFAATVTAITVQAGAQVAAGSVLVELQAAVSTTPT